MQKGQGKVLVCVLDPLIENQPDVQVHIRLRIDYGSLKEETIGREMSQKRAYVL